MVVTVPDVVTIWISPSSIAKMFARLTTVTLTTLLTLALLPVPARVDAPQASVLLPE